LFVNGSIAFMGSNIRSMAWLKSNTVLNYQTMMISFAHQVQQVYYLKYPCENLAAWRVVYKVNPRERLYTPTNSAYHFDDE
jgi:hypothetical protein